jgi:hypothetical protein
MEVLMAQLKEQASQIQKVSAQVEVSKPARERRSTISKKIRAVHRTARAMAVNSRKLSESIAAALSQSSVTLYRVAAFCFAPARVVSVRPVRDRKSIRDRHGVRRVPLPRS